MKRIFFLVLPTICFFCCKSEEKVSNQTLNCYVRYDTPLGRVTAEATMQDVDAKKSVEIPGGIRYQGVAMRLLPSYGLTYQHDYIAEFMPAHRFDWTNLKGGKSQFSMSIDPILSFSVGNTAISHKKPAALAWEGAALQKGETLVLMWENADKGLTVPFEVTTTIGQPIIDIPAEKLRELAPGNWTLYLVRKRLQKANVDGLPVQGIMEYYTKPIEVKVTD